ncbi:MAG: DUF721 domain-containing protein [Kiritimatiellia bacterium]
MTSRRKPHFDKGAWAVQKERFATDLPVPPQPFDVHPLGELIPDVMKKMGMHGRLHEAAMLDEWPQLVGAQLAGHTRPVKLEHDVLTVFVDHSAWLSELSRYGKKQMMDKLNARFGTGCIKSIHLALDPESGRK